jgi:hypothetical protein
MELSLEFVALNKLAAFLAPSGVGVTAVQGMVGDMHVAIGYRGSGAALGS